ncbi:hypothetical protein McanMca71_006839 [Microsporum canis]|uniref:Uncharacterized protein n=1 Tax=Arthroderma otae (strain ATCC MYA-4605 / CBS 113480) TaxID=554155 RepID=C5FN32_ARTOC|nr:uncharacterized protein MCYG_04087 [Microsporum canis CBS 113480]EEQ31268.1 predicted protein [Microsporum canis CBS 113480]
MTLRLFPRGRTVCFNICLDGSRIPGSLDYSTVIHHIPHLRDCPRRPATAQSLGRYTIDINLTAVVRRCRLVDSQFFPVSLFQDCLHILVRVLRDLQRHPSHDPGSTLCDSLEQLLLQNQLDWYKQLRYFTCFAYLFDDSVLKASSALHSGMSNFIFTNCRVLAYQAPLSVSLQFVDLCFHADFSALMTALFEQLCNPDRAELVRTHGLIPLYLGGEPSEAIFTYIIQRFGERGSIRERIKIRARHRVRRRRHGLLDRGLFIPPR